MSTQQNSELVQALFDRATVNGILYFRKWNSAVIAKCVEEMHQAAHPAIARLCDSTSFDPQLAGSARDITLKCVLRKNYDALQAIFALVKDGQAYAAISLLRPMCEELIFAKYLLQLSAQDADEYLMFKLHLELLESRHAQQDYFSSRNVQETTDISGSKLAKDPVRTLKHDILRQRELMRDIGRRLGWGNQPVPSVKHMAEKVGCLDVYGFFYHAASTSVHANVHSLFRLAWGNSSSGQYSINSKHFESYYCRVALVYSAIVFDEVIKTMSNHFSQFWSDGQELEYRKVADLAISHPPALVTEEELRTTP